MYTKRRQNKIAGSRFALPVTGGIALGIWLIAMFLNPMQTMPNSSIWTSSVLFAISTYLIILLNNYNALIRTYSRMVSCSFIIIGCMCAPLFTSHTPYIVQLCLIAFYLILFSCYQDKRSPGKVFYAFLFIGIASYFFPQILYFVPFVWIMMTFNLMTFSSRIFWASLCGIALPYWFMLSYCIFTGKMELIQSHFTRLTEFDIPVNFDNISTHQAITFAFILVLTLTGIIHFLNNSFQDKIRTRMLYEIFITMSILCNVFIILQPQHYDMLLAIQAVNTSALIAHFIALTHTRITNISFHIIVIISFLLIAYNIWMP